MEDAAEQSKSSKADHLKPWQFKPGQSGNPSGKPKGTISLKKFAQKYIQELSEEEKLKFLTGLNKKDIWEMAEGKAENKTDITTDGQPINFIMNSELAAKNNVRSNGETEGSSS